MLLGKVSSPKDPPLQEKVFHASFTHEFIRVKAFLRDVFFSSHHQRVNGNFKHKKKRKVHRLLKGRTSEFNQTIEHGEFLFFALLYVLLLYSTRLVPFQKEEEKVQIEFALKFE